MQDENTTTEQDVLGTIAKWLDEQGIRHDYKDGNTSIQILYNSMRNMVEIYVDEDGEVVVNDHAVNLEQINHDVVEPVGSPNFIDSLDNTLQEYFSAKS